MSRYYRMSVTLESLPETYDLDALKCAMNAEWNFDNGSWFQHADILEVTGESCLYGGEGEDEFAERLTREIFKVLGAPCSVTITAAYLEDPPCETYSFDKEDYDRLTKGVS